MTFPIDNYELRARYAPSLIVVAPFLITLWTCAPSEFQGLSAFTGGILSLIMWYCLAMFVRFFGKKVEPQLWDEWGGNIAANLMLWENKFFNDELKKQYHDAILKYLSLTMSTKDEELLSKETAEKRCIQAFIRVRGVLRKFDPTGLWATDNAEYGFARNIYGSRKAWRFISIFMTGISAIFLFMNWNNLIFLGLCINLSMIYFSFYFGGIVMKSMAKELALRYAQHSWESFLNIARTDNIANRDS